MISRNTLVQLSLLLLFLHGQYICLASGKAEDSKKPGGKNILVYTGASSYSMRISIWPLIEALIDKGHHVTFVSSQPPKVPDPRVTEVCPKKIQEWLTTFVDDLDFTVQRKSGENRLGFYQLWTVFSGASCEALYSDEEALEWMRNSKFDLVVVDSVNDCAYGLAYYFKAKTVTYSTFTVAPWFYSSFGLADDSSWAADMPNYFPAFEPTFFTRMATAVDQLVFQFMRDYQYYPELQKITEKGLAKLGVDKVPSIRELEKNTSVTFITTHYAQEYARAFPPNVIPIGGLALTGKVKPLPKEFEDFIAKGNGFIFMSFGSALDVSQLNQQQKDVIVNALLQFPHLQFIWKAAGELGMDLPENFMVSKWVPQQDLLAHPKIKAFITHGGLGSTNEAIYNAVPMIGFPLLYDQDHNANFLEPKGIGISLEISTLTTEQFKDAIMKVTTDPKYKKNMKKVSTFFKDRPMTPVDTALWWVEFVLRHDAEEITEYLQSRSIDQSWWVRRQLDVWLFLAIIAALSVIIPTYILYRVVRLVMGGGGAQKKLKNH